MMSLKELQNRFNEFLYNDQAQDELDFVKPGDISKMALMAVYRDGLVATLVNTLRLTYPRVYAFLKQSQFEAVAVDFAKKYRSQTGNLDDYGAEFSDFLRQKDLLFLADLARLEWCHQEAFLAANSEDLDVAALQSLDEERLVKVKFQLAPAVKFTVSKFNLKSKRVPKNPNKRDCYYVVFRIGNKVNEEKVSKTDFLFLQGVEAGLTLQEIHEKYQIDVTSALQKFIVNRVLSGFTIK